MLDRGSLPNAWYLGEAKNDFRCRLEISESLGPRLFDVLFSLPKHLQGSELLLNLTSRMLYSLIPSFLCASVNLLLNTSKSLLNITDLM